MRFAFVDRWQTSLRDLFEQKPSNERLLALLEARDRELEAFLAGPGWEDWSPAELTIVVGDGTQIARKRVHPDGTVDFNWSLVLGSTSTITSPAKITLPIPAAGKQTAPAYYLDDGTRHYVGVCEMSGVDGLFLHSESGNNGIVGPTTAPMTWVAGDRIQTAGTIEPEET